MISFALYVQQIKQKTTSVPDLQAEPFYAGKGRSKVVQ